MIVVIPRVPTDCSVLESMLVLIGMATLSLLQEVRSVKYLLQSEPNP
jgi:hypothetical protein